jgi:hypothetical protein
MSGLGSRADSGFVGPIPIRVGFSGFETGRFRADDPIQNTKKPFLLLLSLQRCNFDDSNEHNQFKIRIPSLVSAKTSEISLNFVLSLRE